MLEHRLLGSYCTQTLSFSRLSRLAYAAVAAMAVSLPASADDIDVYSSILASQNKPNIMFVLDYSGSMDSDVQGSATAIDAEKKINILKDAVNALLESNKGKINVGLASMYQDNVSGVRWPASDLEQDAHELDASIPPNTVTVADVIASQLDRMWPNSTTSTVTALAEAAAYFRGEAVTHNDANMDRSGFHKPDTWDQTSKTYSGGAYYSAIPASYLPRDAYKYNVPVGSGAFGYCSDWVDGEQGCDGKATFDCEYLEAYTYDNPAGGVGESAYEANSGTVAARTHCKYHETEQWLGANYESPIQQECQANFIVLISDGQPTTNPETTTVTNAVGGPQASCADLSSSIFGAAPGAATEGNCGPEILSRMANNDVNPSIEDSKVLTYTVGFSIEDAGKEYLKLLASSGNGEFYEANKPSELTDALDKVIDSILSGSQNFAELSIDINRDTFSHDNKTYFSLFTPSSRNSWNGNLKGYFIDKTGLKDLKDEPAIVVGDDGIEFSETAQSFWSDEIDGNNVSLGGASEALVDPNAPLRNLYTHIGPVPAFGVSLSTNASNELNTNNVTAAMTGAANQTAHVEAVEWLQTAPMGAPLHSKPVPVNYSNSTVVYVMTNQGFIHAIDTSYPTSPSASNPDTRGGNELFAFMPQELLSNIGDIHARTRGTDHIYGLDGRITRWHTDANNDGIVNGSDKMLLVFGMRRGGNSYYALDVTNPTSPKLAWQIKGGTADFANLAQTWSTPSLVKVKHNGADKMVLMFGGGYDAGVLDDATARVASSGNAIYIVDENGNLIKSHTVNNNSKMKYSIASDLTVIDIDNDSYADRIYVGDVGGQVWRMDFSDLGSANIQSNVLADVGNTKHRRFFYAPSVSLSRAGGKEFVSVAVGTGDRTNPLNTSNEDAFYSFRDFDLEPGIPAAGIAEINVASEVYDATANDAGSSDPTTKATAQQLLDESKGWVVYLGAGEKSLSKLVSFDGMLMATTFEPVGDTQNIDPCTFTSNGRLYMMNIKDAQPIEILSDGSENSAGLTSNKRSQDLSGTGIPSQPVLIFPKDGQQVQIMVDKQIIDLVNQKIHTVFWHGQ